MRFNNSFLFPESHLFSIEDALMSMKEATAVIHSMNQVIAVNIMHYVLFTFSVRFPIIVDRFLLRLYELGTLMHTFCRFIIVFSLTLFPLRRIYLLFTENRCLLSWVTCIPNSWAILRRCLNCCPKRRRRPN